MAERTAIHTWIPDVTMYCQVTMQHVSAPYEATISKEDTNDTVM